VRNPSDRALAPHPIGLEDDTALREPPVSLSTPSPGQDAEFSRCFAANEASVRVTAYLLCGDWHRAEDLTQAVFLKLYLAWPRLHTHQQLGGYLRQITVRTFLADQRRLRWRRERLVDQPPETPAMDPPVSEDKLVAWQALATLPPRQRAVLVLRFWQDLGVAEAAEVLGCSPGTVKSQTAKGLTALRQKLGSHFAGRIHSDREGGDIDA
jgi:RNA polymerase sigma-70 factor (sigma-E family)